MRRELEQRFHAVLAGEQRQVVLTDAVAVAAEVLHHQQFDQGLAVALDGLAARVHDHPLGDRCGAGGQRARRPFHVDDTGAATAVGVESRVVAQVGDVVLVRLHDLQDRLAFAAGDARAVELEGDVSHRGTL